MPNRFDRGKFNQNPNFTSIASSSSRFISTKPVGTSKQVQKIKKKEIWVKKKKPTQIWVKKEARRDWLELPRDVMLHVFLKLGVIELLCNAQSVCSSWREIARDPILYRRIDITSPLNSFNKDGYYGVFTPIANMAIEAIHRSRGQLVDFSVMYIATNEMLQRIVEASCRLKCLRLSYCYRVSDGALVEAFKKMPSLEVVEMSICSFTTGAVEALGRACPGLKSFGLNKRLRKRGFNIPPEGVTDYSNVEALAIAGNNVEALAIAGNMPGLRSLHLFGNLMTNDGLQAILDKCSHLEYLDIRQCFYVDLKEDLRKKCQGIKILRLPKDSTDDYEFGSTVDPLGLYDDGGDYLSGDEEAYPHYDDSPPFSPIYWSDDEDYKFIHGINEDDCLWLQYLTMGDEYDEE